MVYFAYPGLTGVVIAPGYLPVKPHMVNVEGDVAFFLFLSSRSAFGRSSSFLYSPLKENHTWPYMGVVVPRTKRN